MSLVVYRYTFILFSVASCPAVNIDSLTAASKDIVFQLKCHRYSLPLTDIMTGEVKSDNLSKLSLWSTDLRVFFTHYIFFFSFENQITGFLGFCTCIQLELANNFI